MSRAPRRPAAPAARAIEIGGFGAAFGAVLVVGGLVLGGLWLWRSVRAPSAPGAGPAAIGDAGAVAHDPLTGVTADGHPQLGLATAPVEIVEFSDYQCPNCRQFATEVVPAIKDRWIRTGFVRIVYRDLVVFGADSQRAAEAAQCAGEQGRYWRFHDGLFALRAADEKLDAAHLTGLARGIELDVAAFESCVAAGRTRARVEASTAFAKAQGFRGTPTFLVNGRQVSGAIPAEQWVELFQLYQQELALPSPPPPSPIAP